MMQTRATHRWSAPRIAKAVKASFLERLAHSRAITSNGEVLSRWALTEGVTASQKAIFFILLPLSWLFDFLL